MSDASLRRREVSLVVAALAAGGAIGGCAVASRPTASDTAQHPRATLPAPSLGVAIELVVSPEVAATVARRRFPWGWQQMPEHPVGRIVESSGNEVMASASPSSSSLAYRVVVDAVDCTIDRHLNWLLPLPYHAVSDWRIEVQVTMMLHVLHPGGRVVLQRDYASGPRVLASTVRLREAQPAAILRLIQESSWTLWVQAASDLKDTLSSDRARERTL